MQTNKPREQGKNKEKKATTKKKKKKEQITKNILQRKKKQTANQSWELTTFGQSISYQTCQSQTRPKLYRKTKQNQIHERKQKQKNKKLP